MKVAGYIIKYRPLRKDYFIEILYDDCKDGEPSSSSFGPFNTLRGAKKQIKRWADSHKDNEIIARYDKDGKKIEPLSWGDFC